jgi:hypothetical protein
MRAVQFDGENIAMDFDESLAMGTCTRLGGCFFAHPLVSDSFLYCKRVQFQSGVICGKRIARVVLFWRCLW